MSVADYLGVNGNWADSNNWNGGSGAGGAPANGDTVVINYSSTDIDTNLTTGLTNITLRIGPQYTGTIGAAGGNALDIDGGVFTFASGGPACFMTGVWTSVNVKGGQKNDNMLNWLANASSDIGTLRIFGNVQGTTTLGAAAVIDNVEVNGAPQAKCVITDGVSSLDYIYMNSGVVTCGENIASLAHVVGGRFTLSSDATVAELVCDMNGQVWYNSSGTATLVNARGGVIYGTDNQNKAITWTTLNRYFGATVDLRSDISSFTIGTDNDYQGILRQ